MRYNNPKCDHDGVVTIIIAAYQRPEALNKALFSLYRQTYRQWRALVIGDCCADDFWSQVDRSDDRVTLINLPVRCGHQYGPNSIGIHLAGTEFIAYLNHDDLWLPDHLEMAIRALRNGEANAYLGRAAFFHSKNQPPTSGKGHRLMSSEVNRPDILWRCMTGPFYFFEPASAWVIRTDLAKQVGHWQPPDQVDVTPVMNWLMRLARAGASFHVAETVSVLKINLHNSNQDERPIYHQENPWQNEFDRWMGMSAGELRKEIAEDLARASGRGLRIRREMTGPIKMTGQERDRAIGFLLYLQTGLVFKELTGPPIGPYRSQSGLATVERRTGERLTRFIPVADILAALKSADAIPGDSSDIPAGRCDR